MRDANLGLARAALTEVEGPLEIVLGSALFGVSTSWTDWGI